jgi:tetratricopeptide (TPR) repeat protein
MKQGRVGRRSRRNAMVAGIGSAALLLGAVALPSRADEPAAAAAAVLDRALKAGAAAAARGDHAACVEAYTKALRLEPEATTAGALGLCEESLGRNVAAYNHLRLALESEPAPDVGGGKGPWKRFADAVERLERRVVRAIVVTSPNDAEVFLDGTLVDRKLSGRWVTLLPGEHTWTVKREGYEDQSFTHTARGGDLPDVHFTLLAGAPARLAAAPCDEACRAKIRKEAEDDTNLKWELKYERDMARLTKQVRRDAELIYRRQVDPSFAVLGGFLASVGLTAGPGPGFFLGGEAHWGAFNEVGFSAGLEAQTLFPSKGVTLANGNPLDISQVTAALVPCLRYKWVGGCAVVDVGILIAGSPGPIKFYDGNILVTSGFGPRLGFQVPIAERFMVRGFAELRISPIDTGWTIGIKSPRTWLNPPVSGLFGLGFSFGNPVRMVP